MKNRSITVRENYFSTMLLLGTTLVRNILGIGQEEGGLMAR